MKYFFAAGSRSGSEFSISLISTLVGKIPEPFGRVHSARESDGDLSPPYSFYKKQGKVQDFVNFHRLEALKLEDPGVDDDAYVIFDSFPESIVIATYRPLNKIINSHGNIKPWGMSPERVKHTWSNNLRFYEHAHKHNRLVMISLEDRDAFAPAAAASLLGCKISADWKGFWEKWPIVNDLETQKKYSNDDSESTFYMSREEVLTKYPDCEAQDARYKNLVWSNRNP